MTDGRTGLAGERFEEHRGRLTAVAYRMLGSVGEADDAVQETWVRLSRADAERGRQSRRLADHGRLARVFERAAVARDAARGAARPRRPSTSIATPTATDPEQEALLADAVGLALLVVLEALAPAERVAFVLHDMFAVPFEEIAPDRRSQRDRRPPAREPRAPPRAAAGPGTGHDWLRQAKLVDAFLAAARDGDFERAGRAADPDVVLRADAGRGAARASPPERAAPPRSPGSPATRVAPSPALLRRRRRGRLDARRRAARRLRLHDSDDRITAIELIGDPDRMGALDLAVLGD